MRQMDPGPVPRASPIQHPLPLNALGERLLLLPRPTYPRAWDCAVFPLNVPILAGDAADSIPMPRAFLPYLPPSSVSEK